MDRHRSRSLGVSPAAQALLSYDPTKGSATLSGVGFHDTAPLPRRRGIRLVAAPPFVAFLADLPWYAWAGMFAALCVGALAGGAWAWQDAERAFYLGQSPTLASLRGRLDRLRLAYMRIKSTHRGPAPDMWGELRGIERDLLDLHATARSSRRSRLARHVDESGAL